jgi:hypothetical protein
MNKVIVLIITSSIILSLVVGLVNYKNQTFLEEDACYIVPSKGNGFYKVLKKFNYSYIILPNHSYSKIDNPNIKDEFHGKIPGIYAKSEVSEFERIDCFEGEVMRVYLKILNDNISKDNKGKIK